MEWNREVERDREVLLRLLAMLISFAGMADRLPSLSFAQRRDLLIPLRRAEACLRDFIFATVHDLGIPLPCEAYLALSAVQTDRAGGPGECLAMRFRALATVLAAMLQQAARFNRTKDRQTVELCAHAHRHAVKPMPVFMLTGHRRCAIRARDAPGPP